MSECNHGKHRTLDRTTGRCLTARGPERIFVASEFAFIRIRGTSVEQLAAEGRTGAATASKSTAMSLRLRPLSKLASQRYGFMSRTSLSR